MRLDEKLVHLRKENGLTQLELAEAVNVSRQAVSKWESGGGMPSTENLQYLSKLYNISLEDLLDNEKDVPLKKDISQKADKDFETGKNYSTKRIITLVGICICILALVGCLAVFSTLSQRNQEKLDLENITGEVMPVTEGDFSLSW